MAVVVVVAQSEAKDRRHSSDAREVQLAVRHELHVFWGVILSCVIFGPTNNQHNGKTIIAIDSVSQQ
jgi:hypothetical protein